MKRPSTTCSILSATAITIAIFATGPAAASSDEAWRTFRAELADKCAALAADRMNVGGLRIDPFGSQSFGVAIVVGDAQVRPVERICVMDKKTRRVELSGPMPPVEADALPGELDAVTDAPVSTVTE